VIVDIVGLESAAAHIVAAGVDAGLSRPALLLELQSLQYHVHTDFVAKLETVDERVFRVVDSDWYSVDSLFLNSSASLSRPMLLSQGRLFSRADFISCRRPIT
jgi:hypothetical protein